MDSAELERLITVADSEVAALRQRTAALVQAWADHATPQELQAAPIRIHQYLAQLTKRRDMPYNKPKE